MAHSDIHRALIQAFMGRKSVTAADGRKILAAILQVTNGGESEVAPGQVSEGALLGYIGEVNDELSHFDLEIRSMRDQSDRSNIYALVNTTSDDIIQTATPFSADELAYFRRVLDAMFITNNTLRAEVLAVRAHDAMHLNKAPRLPTPDPDEATATQAPPAGLSISAAEAALDSFVEHGWLVKSRKNWYSLGSRALMELSGYLTGTYNRGNGDEEDEDEDEDEDDDGHGDRIKNCYACKELLTVGQRCDKLACTVRMHEPCSEQFFKTARDRQAKCPTCSTLWTGEEKVGEGAAGKLGAPVRARQQLQKERSAPLQTQKPRRRQAVGSDEEEELPDAGGDAEEAEEAEEEEEDEEED